MSLLWNDWKSVSIKLLFFLIRRAYTQTHVSSYENYKWAYFLQCHVIIVAIVMILWLSFSRPRWRHHRLPVTLGARRVLKKWRENETSLELKWSFFKRKLLLNAVLICSAWSVLLMRLVVVSDYWLLAGVGQLLMTALWCSVQIACRSWWKLKKC